MVSFVHFADLHVDRNQSGKRGKKFALRVYDMLNHLDSIVDFSIAKNVDFVLFSGDMYHTHTPKQEMRSEVHTRILRLVNAGIPFYGIPGNHDMVKRESSRDALYELTSLQVSGVHIFHEPGFVDCGDYAIAGIPWSYSDFDWSEFKLPDKPVYAIVHATVLGAVYGSGADTSEMILGREFVLTLEPLTEFAYVGLGHIHKPQILHTAPYILYPGSVGWQTWGEAKDPPHTFVYFNGGDIEQIPFVDRARYSYELEATDPVPEMLDPNSFYRFIVPDGFPVMEISAKYADAYNVDINVVRQKVERRFNKSLDALPNMSLKEQLRLYFELTDQDFSEVEAIFEDIADSLI